MIRLYQVSSFPSRKRTNTEDPINRCMELSFLSVSHHVFPHPTLEKLMLNFKFGDISGGVEMRGLLAGQGFTEFLEHLQNRILS